MKCGSKYFARFEKDKAGCIVPLLRDAPDTDGLAVQLFNSICDAKEVCSICAHSKHVSHVGQLDECSNWSIIAVNRVFVDEELEDGSFSGHEELVEVGTVWSLDV